MGQHRTQRSRDYSSLWLNFWSWWLERIKTNGNRLRKNAKRMCIFLGKLEKDKHKVSVKWWSSRTKKNLNIFERFLHLREEKRFSNLVWEGIASKQWFSRVVPRLATWASPGNLLKMQNFKLHPRLAEWETQGVGPEICILIRDPDAQLWEPLF